MDSLDCLSQTCSFCSHLRKTDYLGSKKASADRLQQLVDERMCRGLKPAIITETFDWEYQEWVDNELSLKGEPA